MYLLRWLLNSVIKLHLLFCFVFYLCNFIWVNICLIILQTMWTTLSYDVSELRWWEGLIFIRFKTSIFIVLVSGWKNRRYDCLCFKKRHYLFGVCVLQEIYKRRVKFGVRKRPMTSLAYAHWVKAYARLASAVPTMAKYMVEGEIKKAN